MLPALSLKPADRETLASTAKAFANVGQFAVVAAVPPIVSAISGREGGTPAAWQTVAIVASILMIVFMWVFGRQAPAKVNRRFRLIQIASAGLMAFNHGDHVL